MRKISLSLVTISSIAFISTLAQAAPVRVCVEAMPHSGLYDYSPRPGNRDLGEDFGRVDGRLGVPGVLLRVEEPVQNGANLWGWMPTDDDGCSAVFDSLGNADLQAEVYYWSRFDDVAVDVISLTCDDSVSYDCQSGSYIASVQVPPTGGDRVVQLPVTRQAYIHYAAAFAESRSRIWATERYYTRTSANIATIANRYAGGMPTANYNDTEWRRKFTIAHEYGHLQTLVVPVSAFSNADVDFCFMDPACSLSHVPESQEWHSAAVVEGFADFYAMATWNDRQESGNGVMSWSATSDS